MKRELVSATMEVPGGPNRLDREVNIDGYVYYHTDTNYGADADGNRGVRRTFVDDVTEVSARDFDGEDVSLCPADTDRAAELLTRKFLEG